MPPAPRATARSSTDALSPELALIDPSLAAAARLLLPDAEDTLVRLARHRLTETHTGPEDLSQRPSAPRTPHPGTTARTWRAHEHRRTVGLAGAVAAGAIALALLIGVRVDLQGHPADADTSVAPPATVKTHATKSVSARPQTHPKAAPRRGKAQRGPTTSRARRFAWAPTAGATGYYVEFFRAGTRVFASRTTAPTLEISERWQFEGAEQSFRAGTYSWYVWPIVGGQRSTHASVQTTVSIPRS